MNEEFYIGQVFEGSYPPMAANWCNANHAFIDVIGTRVYEIKAVPEPPAPTHEDIRVMRAAYRRTHIDDQTLERGRKMANGSWTEEDETDYLALDAEVTAYIEENFPYPDEEGETEDEQEEVAGGTEQEEIS